jgi:hypothetical protein
MIVFPSLLLAGKKEDKINVIFSSITEISFQNVVYFKQAILIINDKNYYVCAEGEYLG